MFVCRYYSTSCWSCGSSEYIESKCSKPGYCNSKTSIIFWLYCPTYPYYIATSIVVVYCSGSSCYRSSTCNRSRNSFTYLYYSRCYIYCSISIISTNCTICKTCTPKMVYLIVKINKMSRRSNNMCRRNCNSQFVKSLECLISPIILDGSSGGYCRFFSSKTWNCWRIGSTS